MIQLILSALWFWQALPLTTSPLVSNLGEDTFRSGEVQVVIGSQSQHDIEAPYVSPLSGSPAALALSMIQYSQVFDATNKIHYYLYENTPSLSNSTTAVFRVELWLYSFTSLARIKYLACPASILSQNFNIVINQFNPGTLQPCCTPPNTYDHTVTTPLNAATGYAYALWLSGM